jgi:carboxyl-terminal processing protease
MNIRMNISKFLIIGILSLSIFASCKKDNVIPSTTTLTPAMARDSLYNYMNDMYYWYNLMPTVNKDNYADPDALLKAMIYKPLDKWSYITDYDKLNAMVNGDFIGHGFSMGLDDSLKARIAMIYPVSPLYAEGVRRGWFIEKINGTEVAPILISRDSAAYANLLGPKEAGITNIFLFKKPDGTKVTISSTKSKLSLPSVILYDTLNLTSGVTGHLVFDSFFKPAENELYNAFTYFNSTGIKDLILDLRYNSGGALYIAQELASYIAGTANPGSAFVKLSYNDKHTSENVTYSLLTPPYALSLTRMVVITTRATASASECLMNGLKPYMTVVSVGDTTDGKPAGMNPYDIEKKYVVVAINFKIVNKDDQGDYFDGIPPTSFAQDDITRDFNDRKEICLKDAISYLETGGYTAKSLSLFKRYPKYSEKPAWMNNAFDIRK